MNLRIKQSVKNQIITRRFVGRGEVRIDTNKEFTQAHMKNLYNGGFSDLFEYIEDEPKTLVDKTFVDIKDDLILDTTPSAKPVIKTEPKTKKKNAK